MVEKFLREKGRLILAVFLSFSALIPVQPAEIPPDTPWPTSDWVTSLPEQEGMDSSRLEEASQFIDASCPTRFSLLVVRNGRLVFERYYHGSYSDQANNIKSMSKSILSVLTGVALDEGLLTNVDQKLDEFFPEYFLPGDDPRKHDIILEHLLTMTAGFEWVENGPITSRWFSSPDWHQFTIQSTLVSNPGEVYNYSTALTHLLSGILTKVSGTSTRDFAASRLFDPLGMNCVAWSRDPRGYCFGGSEVWLTPRDLARFGLLFLRQGQWEDRRIVSVEWLREASRLRVRTGADTGDYGYLWWKKTLLGYPVTLAAGYGGQFVFLVPDLDIVVVTTARSDLITPYQYNADPYNIMVRYILPAVRAGRPEIDPGGIVHLPDHGACLASGAFASVSGNEFSLAETTWDEAMPVDGRFPPGIGGVQVFLGGRRAFPSYVSDHEIRFLVLPDMSGGHHSLEIRTPQGSAFGDVDVAPYAPALYTQERDGQRWASLRPAFPGSVVDLKASGLGPSVPPAPAGGLLDQPRPLAETPEVWVAGRPAQILAAELASAGVWHLRIRLPDDLAAGSAAVQVRAGGVLSQGKEYLQVTTTRSRTRGPSSR